MKKEKKSKFRKFSPLSSLSHRAVLIISANQALAKARAFLRSFSPPSSPIDRQELITISPVTTISLPKISHVDKINPRDLIVHRVINTDDRSPTNYFREKYKNYLKPSLLYPKQYYQDLLNQRIDSPKKTTDYSWNQCVQRLNTEYRLTIDALEQAKECLKQVSFNLHRLPPKTLDFIQPSTPKPPISPRLIKFAKPKLIKPVQLQTFTELKIIEDESPRIHFKPLIITHEIPKSSPPEIEDEEETTYTVETIYSKDFRSTMEEKTTEEQFNSISNPRQKPISLIPVPKINSSLNRSINIPRRIKPPSKSIRSMNKPLLEFVK